MEKIKHTPGPWHYKKDSFKISIGNKSTRHDYLEHDYTVAVINDNSFQSEANARLIAVAPDLLEACRELWFAIQVIPVDWNNPEAKELSAKAIDAMDGAELAMNRAEGRE